MPINKILFTFGGMERGVREAAERNAFSGNLVFTTEQEAAAREIADADVVAIGLFSRAMLAAARNLHFVQAMTGGVPASVLFPQMLSSAVPLTCLKPLFGPVGGEHALAAMLHFARKFQHVPNSIPMTQWDNGHDVVAEPFELNGKTVGIVGMGGIGKTTADLARTLGMRVLGLVRTARDIAGTDGIYTRDRLGEFLRECAFVVIAVPLTHATAGMVDAEFLNQMRPSAYLIDVSARPAILDYPALVQAVEEGWIAGVCLQPGGASTDLGVPPTDAPFWKHPNVFVTPCRATSVELNETACDFLFENVRRWDAGETLLGLVDKAEGY